MPFIYDEGELSRQDSVADGAAVQPPAPETTSTITPGQITRLRCAAVCNIIERQLYAWYRLPGSDEPTDHKNLMASLLYLVTAARSDAANLIHTGQGIHPRDMPFGRRIGSLLEKMYHASDDEFEYECFVLAPWLGAGFMQDENGGVDGGQPPQRDENEDVDAVPARPRTGTEAFDATRPRRRRRAESEDVEAILPPPRRRRQT